MTAILLSETEIPVFDNISDIYDKSVLDHQKSRYARIQESFKKRFNQSPNFFARSPGRVNLIGEHIDYAGFSVLPMAIDRDVVCAVSVVKETSARVILCNTNDKYPERSFTKESILDIDSTKHEWSNYFKCGYKGISESVKLDTTSSLFVMMDGSVPAGAGVSSSSAFVCCSALATLHANNQTMNKGELIQASICGERYAGVETGGMDQSISIMAPFGSPLIIHFYPKLSADPVIFSAKESTPVFVIANTLITADKHVTAPTNYNLRVVETRLAAAILAKILEIETNGKILTLRDIEEKYQEKILPLKSKTDNEKMDILWYVENHFKKDGYTYEQAAKALEMDVSRMMETYVGSIVIKADVFELYKRTKHVFNEARRVFLFKDACETVSKDLFSKLGGLMNDSQDSCRDYFNCSCPEIDELTKIAVANGAFGSRLTGAGWGGCTVSLVAPNDVARFIDSLKNEYYFKNFPKLKSTPELMDDYIFASKPSIGCGILRQLEF